MTSTATASGSLAVEVADVLPWMGPVTRHLFFTGKGGVGKTTVASATALRLAEAGWRTLIVSTDPASNLDDVFAMRAGTTPTAVPGIAALWIMNLDPEAAAAGAEAPGALSVDVRGTRIPATVVPLPFYKRDKN